MVKVCDQLEQTAGDEKYRIAGAALMIKHALWIEDDAPRLAGRAFGQQRGSRGIMR
jgi:hypothetical protein